MKTPIPFRASILKARAPLPSVPAIAPARPADDAFLTPTADLRGYKRLVDNSAILPQCIRAYRNNIAGFGFGIRYREDMPETPEMRAEWDRVAGLLDGLGIDRDNTQVFEDLIEARETYGVAYLEVMRNLSGEVVGVECVRQTPTIRRTAPLDPPVPVSTARFETRARRFCKYRQESAGNTVYFKEMGDPRAMDRRTGAYSDAIASDRQANELLAFPIGVEPYGEVRWVGQILGVDGSRRAEALNNRYFSEGRHTPLMILVKGGTLTEDSYRKLQSYMDGIRGEQGQHAFIVLEAAGLDSRTDFDAEKPPDIEVRDLASTLQRDELFQSYLDNNRRRVQSAFQLPDLYVGYTSDFTRATATAAQDVTEKQVFQPERRRLAWIINHKLLADYHFAHVEAFFRAPELTSPDDIAKILAVTARFGGLTPNKAKEITHKLFGETAEAYAGAWGDVPLGTGER